MYPVTLLATLLLASLTEAGQKRPQSETRPFYSNSKNILELTASTFNDYVYTSNYTTIVEFYAPWCGYCKELRPEFEAAAKAAHHYAQFAAVNCDDKQNQAFCQEQGVTGFPTLFTYRPPKTYVEGKRKSTQYVMQPYENKRTSEGIVSAMKGQVKGFTKKVTQKNLDKLFTKHKEISDLPKVVYFTDDNQVSPMYKSLALDFKNEIDFYHAIARDDKYLEMAKKYISPDIESLSYLTIPTIVILDPNSEEVVVYEGELKKHHISKFLTQFGTPSEGDFSERAEIVKGIKDGTHKSFKDYRKKKAKAAKAAQESKQAEPTLAKDEL